MVSREEVIATARKIIADNVPDAFGDDIDDDTVLNVEGNIDSMGFILLVTKMEGAFGVKIPDDEWDQLRSLNDLADAVLKYLPKDEGQATDDGATKPSAG